MGTEFQDKTSVIINKMVTRLFSAQREQLKVSGGAIFVHIWMTKWNFIGVRSYQVDARFFRQGCSKKIKV